MYLLMLLATFLSAIYGYNLSARPDYDRDIPRKKAMAVLYRFSRHHYYAHRLAARIDSDTTIAPAYVLPGDIMYARGEAEMTYDGVSDTPVHYNMDGYMEMGRRLYPKEEMTTKIICLDRPVWCTNDDHDDELCIGPDGNKGKARLCESTVDPSNPSLVLESCCEEAGARGERYIVSYRIIDARWTDRVSNAINIDFWRALEGRKALDNIGIITKREDGKWEFRGKMNFKPSYERELREWETNEDTKNKVFPLAKRYVTNWILPNSIFDADFFKNYGGNNMCEDGCIFKIKDF